MPPTNHYVCDYCGERWLFPISAAMCCCPAAFNEDDETNVERSTN